MLADARQGRFNFMNVVKSAVQSIGWQVEWREASAPELARSCTRGGYAMFHMKHSGAENALCFRRSYHYPFWSITPHSERWRSDVARATFDAASIDPDAARDFTGRLRRRVWRDTKPREGDYILIPLQGKISEQRSFQTCAPLSMVDAIARTGRRAIATLHPRESYSHAERAALDRIAARWPNLTIGGDSRALLPDCSFVATMNSAVAFDGYIIGKPAVLFAQIDFHHIALNVAELGIDAAIERAPGHRPDFDAYLTWFLGHSINARAEDAEQQVLAAMKKGGWPI
ncbi:MAG: hypothetical protein Q4F71_03415 [Paracoccus sp. (in: a-proteobacteria)]|nr:hypothetical protein [Paracoccus sp. (in: a-proteobacteria)]